MKIWVGVDVHKASYAVAILSENGVFHHFSTPSDNLGLIRQFQERGMRISGLACEAGPTEASFCQGGNLKNCRIFRLFRDYSLFRTLGKYA